MKTNILVFVFLISMLGIARNQAQPQTAVRLETTGKITNTVIYNNLHITPVSPEAAIAHSASDSALAGVGNVLLPISPFSHDYKINSSSKAYNAGNKHALRPTDTLDLDYRPRVMCDHLDIGAYEFPIIKTEITKQPENTRICEGTTLTLCADAKGTNVTYQWQHNGLNISGAVHKTLTIGGFLSDSGHYRVIALGDCCNDTSAPAHVKIDAQPMILAMSDTTIFSGEDITLQVLVAQGDSVFWLEGDYLTKVEDIHLKNITQTCEYIAVAKNGVCPETAEDPVFITVSGMPCHIKTKPDTMLCFGDSYRLIPDITNSTTSVKTWLVLGTAQSLENGAIITPSSDAKYIAIGELSDQPGITCRDTLSIQIRHLSLAAMSNLVVCENVTVTLSSSPFDNVEWRDLAGNLLGSGNTEIMPEQNVSTPYVAVLSDGVCTVRDTVMISVNPPNLRAFADDTAICESEPVYLTTNLSPSLVTWIDPKTGTTLPLDPVVSPTETSVFEAWAYDEICGDVSVQVVINVEAKPDYVITTPETPVCKGEPLSLTASQNTAYWTLLDGTRIRESERIADTSDTFIGTYISESGICTVSDTIHVSVEDPSIIACADTTIEQGDSVRLCSTPEATRWRDLETNQTLPKTVVAPSKTAGYIAVMETTRCWAEDTMWVYVRKPDTFFLEIVSDAGCAENDGRARVLVSGSGAPYAFLWSNGATDSVITGLAAGETVSVTVTNCNGKSQTAETRIPAWTAITIDYQTVIPSDEACANGQIKVAAQGGMPPYSYLWSDGFASFEDGSRHSIESGAYTLEVMDANGCVERLNIHLTCTYRRVMPTLYISPNGDGLNDYLNIKYIERYPINTVIIVNSYGDEIIRLENYNNRDVIWNGRNRHGKVLPDGVYYYIVEAHDIESMAGWLLMEASKR